MSVARYIAAVAQLPFTVAVVVHSGSHGVRRSPRGC